jgi:steroid delta-isomerase-like uncharacterized protein
MSIQENIKLDDEFLAGWNAHNADRAVAVLSEDAVWQDLSSPEPIRGKAAARQFVEGWFKPFPDLQSVVKNRLVTEDQVAVELEFTGTNTGPLQLAPGAPAIPATGKAVKNKGVYFLRIQNGKVAEVHSYPDAAGLMMQLGLMASGG